VFDASGPTFRDELYTEYKATRSPMPDDLREQIAPIHEVVRLLGWQVVAVPGVEADDVIATLARTAAAQGIDVIVSSGDKDLSQLVNEHVTIIDTMNGKKRDIAGVTAEFGVPPALMIDYQALVGDTVDNVPGVTKVGPKTAAKWLEEYGSLDHLIANAASIKGVAGQNLRDAIASGQLALSRQLVTMKTDCDLAGYVDGLPQLDAVTLAEPDNAALAPFYEKYGFKGLARTAAAASPEAAPQKPAEAQGGLFDAEDAEDAETTEIAVAAQQRDVVYHTILDEAELDAWLARIHAAELTALDTETDSLDEMVAQIVGISFSVQVGEAAYIPLRHEGLEAPEQLDMALVLAKLKPWLEDPAKKKLGQHVKYDQHVFANHGITVRGYAHDTMLQSYVLEVHRPHNLSSLALRHVNRTGISYEDLCGKGKNQIPFAHVAVEKAAAYSCEDSDQTLDVHGVLWPQIQANPGLLHIYELEIQTSEALFRMERNGVRIDAGELARQSNDLGTRILQLENEAYEIAGQQFNLSSPKQLGEIFFDKLGLPVVKKTATGARSTDEEVLEKLAEDYPLPAKILAHRSLSKLKGTYTDKLAQMALPSDGRVHTHYAQAVAVTGRLSSNDPNLQNIPVRTPEGRRIREAFVAPEGKLIASADYSQIELRIMAHLSGDEALLQAFRQGLDVHRATAAEVFGVELDQVSSEQRRYAKVINFGLIYGMSSFGLAKNLGIETKAAAAYIDKYFQRYPGVKRYMDETVELAHSQGYVETVFGRRLYLPEINGGNGPRKKAAERAAINAPMQGTAADLIKKAMVAVQARLDAERPNIKVIMQVHDELVFELPQAEQDWVRSEIPALMAGVADLHVPLLAEIGFGPDWEKAH
ncbi:MAG: DNA polymerase I, partial [Comamonas sp.]|nr:DNA polymerase I [Comamonas sp.]